MAPLESSMISSLLGFLCRKSEATGSLKRLKTTSNLGIRTGGSSESPSYHNPLGVKIRCLRLEAFNLRVQGSGLKVTGLRFAMYGLGQTSKPPNLM